MCVPSYDDREIEAAADSRTGCHFGRNSDRDLQARGRATHIGELPREEYPRGVREAGSGSKTKVPRGMAEERKGEGRGRAHTQRPLWRSGDGQCLFVSSSLCLSHPLVLPRLPRF